MFWVNEVAYSYMGIIAKMLNTEAAQGSMGEERHTGLYGTCNLLWIHSHSWSITEAKSVKKYRKPWNQESIIIAISIESEIREVPLIYVSKYLSIDSINCK